VRLGRADLVFAGAAEAPVTPLTLASFTSLGVLAEAGPRDPYWVFDRRRRGMVLGEGAAVLMVESREHARRRGARVRAELAGSGLAGEAHGYFDFDPAGSGGTDAMQACLRDAGLTPAGIDTIVAHGTGTRVNDAYESTVLGAVFGADASRPLVVGTKPMTGHTLGASGAIETALLVLMMDAGIVPTTVNWGERDPDCPLRYVSEAEDRPPRTALVCAYGFGGFCGCLAVRKA
jgi:3-oxoacyl-[acyl-carrier-protein] synthase II